MILEIIVFTILTATILNLLLVRLHIPTIIGYIATGIIISYFLQLSHDTHSHELDMIAEFGIVFLMFTIGLEFSIRHLVRMRKEVFLYGGLQVGLSIVIFYLIAHYFFHIDVNASVIIAAALALSSTAIVLKILNSNRDINKAYGQRSLGILIFQDIMVIPILLMITIFSAKDLSLGNLLLKTAWDATLLFILLWVMGRYILEPFLSEVVKSNSNEIFIGSILFLVIGSSVLAHSLGFSYSLGAFIAGMIIAETRFKHQVEADLIPFRDLLLGIFFVTVGMQIDFDIVASYFVSILALFLLFTIVKIAIIFLLLLKSAGKRVALKTAMALFQLGEFGLVVFELANSKNLIDPTISQILIVTITLSMVITPFVLRNITQLANMILRDDEEIMCQVKMKKNLQNHIIVLGYGRLGHKICEKFEKSGIRYVAVEMNIANVKEAQKEGKSVIFGNAAQKSILEAINISEAAVVIVALDNSEKLHLICEVLTQIAVKAHVVIKVDKFREKELLEEEFPDYEIIVGTEEMARGMVNSVLRCEI